MTILQRYDAATQKAIAAYRDSLDLAVNGPTVDIDALLEAVDVLRKTVTPILGAEGAEGLLEELSLEDEEIEPLEV